MSFKNKLIGFVSGLFLIASAVEAREFIFAWDAGSPAEKILYELRTAKNSENWDTNTIDGLTYTKTINILPGDKLKVEIRSIPKDASVVCGNPPTVCEPSNWVTIEGVDISSGMTYLDTPNIVNYKHYGWGVSGVGSMYSGYIGTSSPQGTYTNQNNVITLKSGRGNFGSTSDNVYFVGKTLNQVIYSSRVISVMVTDIDYASNAANSNVGISFRQGLESSSAHFSLTVSKDGKLIQRTRTVLGGAQQELSTVKVTLPTLIRVSKSGNLFVSEYSLNGVTWKSAYPVETIVFDNIKPYYIGFVAAGGDVTAGTLAQFNLTNNVGFW